jgi:hypothetical protein
MDLPLESPDFQARGLAVRLGGFFRGPRIVIDGSEVKGRWRRFLVRNNRGEEVTIRLISNHIDPIPKVMIGSTAIQLARPLEWYEYVWIGLPILLMFHGGFLGAVCGILAIRLSADIFRGSGAKAKRFLQTGMVSLASVAAYLVLSFAFLQLIHWTPPAHWTATASSEGGFSVSMPGKATVGSKAITTPFGPVQMHFWSVERGRDAAFLVAYSDYPEQFAFEKGADALLDISRDGTVSNLHGQLLKETRVTLNGYPGREIRVTVLDGKGVFRHRMFLAGHRLYQLGVATKPTEVESPEIDRFFNSFKLASNAKH